MAPRDGQWCETEPLTASMQRNVKDSEKNQGDRFHEGKENSHNQIDAKDERSIANKLERESKREQEKDQPKSEEDKERKIDATLPVCHFLGNICATRSFVSTD